MVRIVGGGISALTLAFELSERKVPFEIYESSDRLGGLLATKRMNSGQVELAANAVLWSPDLQILLTKLKLRPLFPKPTAKNRWFFNGDTITRWPLNVSETLRVLAYGFRFIFLKQSLMPSPTETMSDYFSRHLGRASFIKLIRPALQGVYGPTVDQLSASLVLGKYFSISELKRNTGQSSGPEAQKKGLRSASFEGGMQDLISALTNAVTLRGAVFLNRRVTLKDFNLNSGPVVLCTDLNSTLELLKPDYPQVLDEKGPEMAGLVSVTCFFNNSQSPAPLSGFGCLWSGDRKSAVLGVLFNSDIFPGRTKENMRSETWIMDHRQLGTLRDQLVLDVILEERKALYGFTQEPIEFHVQRWPTALPIYDRRLQDWIQRLGPFGERALGATPIRLHGNYLGEIGLSGLCRRSQELADRLMEMQ